MPNPWPDSKEFWHNRRVMVTGGAGFLGKYVVRSFDCAQERERGAAEITKVTSVIVPRSSQYDPSAPLRACLRDISAIRRLFRDVAPQSAIGNLQSAIIVIHLAARVGGIGANSEHPAEFFYDNLMMSAPLLHESWNAGVEKFVALGTICYYPNPSTEFILTKEGLRTWFTPVPFREENLCLTAAIPRRRMRRTAWQKRCCWCRANRTGSSTGSTVFS